MNEDINKLSPFISQEVIVANQFLSYEQESAENTGRFKSLNDTQNGFEISCNSLNVKEVIALAEFKADNPGELCFNVGDRIQLIKNDDPS